MFENTLHYSTQGERTIIERAADRYDSLIIPAHFAAKHSDANAGLIERLKKNVGIDYYIEPQLPEYRVGDNFLTDEGSLSQWNQILADYYGTPIADLITQEGNLRYTQLSREEQRTVVEKSCEFQLSRIPDAADRGTLGKYQPVSVSLEPRAIIPWYIKIRTSQDVELNRQIISDANNYTDFPIKPCFFITIDALQNDSIRRQVIDILREADIREIFLCIEDLDKRESTIREYLQVIRLVSQISEIGVDPHFLHASFFGHILGYFGASGVGFGVRYGESKSEKDGSYQGGGPTPNRYYFQPVSEFLNIPDAHQIGQEMNADLCDCSVCEFMDSWDDLLAIGENTNQLSRHYIAARDQERQMILSSSLSGILSQLEEADEKYKSRLNQTDSVANADHLRKWRKSVEVYLDNESIIDAESVTVNLS